MTRENKASEFNKIILQISVFHILKLLLECHAYF